MDGQFVYERLAVQAVLPQEWSHCSPSFPEKQRSNTPRPWQGGRGGDKETPVRICPPPPPRPLTAKDTAGCPHWAGVCPSSLPPWCSPRRPLWQGLGTRRGVHRDPAPGQAGQAAQAPWRWAAGVQGGWGRRRSLSVGIAVATLSPPPLHPDAPGACATGLSGAGGGASSPQSLLRKADAF